MEWGPGYSASELEAAQDKFGLVGPRLSAASALSRGNLAIAKG
jgi:hypothetical protein